MNQTRSISSPATSSGAAPLATRISDASAALQLDDLPAEVIDKVKLCLFDIIGCAFESRDLPWSRQALALATPVPAGASIIGAPIETTPEAAAFANAVMGHGLVREDMHSGSISHLGIVVLPTLLALAQTRKVSGHEFIVAAVLGYEVGGRIGRALMDADIARIHRPTGITGPAAAAAAGARMLGLGAPAMTTAVALGANTTVGLNQWAHTGGSEMFFHAGYAARNAVTAVRLAEQGAFASPSAFDGEAGLFAAFGKRAAADSVTLFQGEPEILAVYHKPVPACNFAQTPSQAALAIARETGIAPERIESITIRVPSAGARYPGCDYSGPFAHILQAKMSIQYNVAAALMLGDVTEANFALLEDSQLKRLIAATRLEVDDEMTRAYPGLQGAGVEVRESGGAVHSRRLDDVVNASAAEVRARFRTATESVVGAGRARQIAICIETLDRSDDAGQLAALLRD